MSVDDIKIKQKISLELLKAFVSICEKYDIRYYLGGGSMLGAVRHHGFIPWDDDIDIDIPRKDYLKFLSISKEALKEYPYYILDPCAEEKSASFGTRFGDIRAKCSITDRMTDCYTYIAIDVIPVDGVPDNKLAMKMFLAKVNFYKMCYRYSTFSTGVIRNDSKNGKRVWYKRFLVYLGTKFPVEKIFKKEICESRLERVISKYSFYECKMAGTLLSDHGVKSIFPVGWYGKGTKYMFENIEVIGVDNYDAWLTQLYGDYMNPPPVEQQIDHAFNIVN